MKNYAYNTAGDITSDGLRGTAMTYVNDADGGKLSTTLNGTLLNIYCGDFVYGPALTVDHIRTPNGQMTRNATSGTYSAQYSLTDHLGSTRCVVNQSGTVLQKTDYYPYGLPFTVANLQSNRYLYNGKELEHQTLGQSYLGTLDYGARHYDPLIARWHSTDPLQQKYLDISPYAYCAGDPVNLVDVDGKRIYFAEGVSEEFKIRFMETVKFMNECGTSYNIAEIQSSDRVYYIDDLENAPLDREGHKRVSSYIHYESDGSGSATLYWDPFQVVMNVQSGLSWSPTTVLAHEFGHLKRLDRALDGGDEQLKAFNESAKDKSDPVYGNKEDRLTISKTEQYAAFKHGEINSDQVTRYNHNGMPAYPPPGGWQSLSPKEISRYVSEQLNFNFVY